MMSSLPGIGTKAHALAQPTDLSMSMAPVDNRSADRMLVHSAGWRVKRIEVNIGTESVG